MKTQKEKFRIKIIEKNDGTFMYYPQFFAKVGIKRYMFFIKIDYYEWRGIGYINNDINFIENKTWLNRECDGDGSSDINDAYKLIEDYKIQEQKRYELKEKKEKQKFNEATKSVTFINIE